MDISTCEFQRKQFLAPQMMIKNNIHFLKSRIFIKKYSFKIIIFISALAVSPCQFQSKHSLAPQMMMFTVETFGACIILVANLAALQGFVFEFVFVSLRHDYYDCV